MRSFAPTGLRGRLMLALVVTAAITLVATAAVLLGPLRERLRQESVKSLDRSVENAVLDTQAALVKDIPVIRAAGSRRGVQSSREYELELAVQPLFSQAVALGLSQRTGARVLVTSGVAAWYGAVYDTGNGPVPNSVTYAGLHVQRTKVPVRLQGGDDVTIGVPLYGPKGDVMGALVVYRPLTEVSTAVALVRNALLAAALVGLAVAIALAVGLSRTLTRRLGRLRTAALRITAEGPDAPTPPRDLARDEVGDLARALGRMQEELRRQEAARRSFVATASHELRTPLTMLQGTMELLEEDLRDGRDLEDAQEQVTSARRELLRLSALAGELLDLSRLDAAVQLRSEPIEIGELVRAVAAEFALRARDRGVDVDVVPPPEPVWGRGDPDAVARVVRILLDNALRYGPEGQPVRVATRGDGSEIAVEVVDRGPGIPEEEREHIFQRFHRGRSATSASGFGLGLAIGRELAERMSGRLELAEPLDGAGARFVLSLPAADPATRGAPPAAQGRVLT